MDIINTMKLDKNLLKNDKLYGKLNRILNKRGA